MRSVLVEFCSLTHGFRMNVSSLVCNEPVCGLQSGEHGKTSLKYFLNILYSPWQHMVKNDFAPACHKCYNEHLGKVSNHANLTNSSTWNNTPQSGRVFSKSSKLLYVLLSNVKCVDLRSAIQSHSHLNIFAESTRFVSSKMIIFLESK